MNKKNIIDRAPQHPAPGAPGATEAERAAWLADKIAAGGDYAKEAAAMLRRWPALQQQEVPREPVARMVAIDDGLGTVILQFLGERPPAGTMLYASPSTTQQQEVGSVPAEVIAWRDAYAEYVAASDAYNARLTAIREREAMHPNEFGRDNPQAEWKAIDKAHSKWHALLRPMFEALATSPSTPERAEKDTSAPSGTEGGEQQ